MRWAFVVDQADACDAVGRPRHVPVGVYPVVDDVMDGMAALLVNGAGLLLVAECDPRITLLDGVDHRAVFAAADRRPVYSVAEEQQLGPGLSELPSGRMLDGDRLRRLVEIASAALRAVAEDGR